MKDCYSISFIVIGRNQERTIYNCIKSILDSIKFLSLENYEVIYVDSMSEDNTIDIIKQYFEKRVCVYRISGYMNAAIGRNFGSSVAKGDVLFFIDGDMEINPKFLSKVYCENSGLKYDFISGKLKENIFNKQWVKVRTIEDRYNVSKETYSGIVGGVFLIKASLFNNIGGFRNEMRINEDTDFSLRLAKNKILLLRIPETIALHNTFDLNNYSTAMRRILRGDQLYSGLLLRRHIFNKYFYKEFIDRHKMTFILLISILLSIYIHPICMLIYPLAIFIKQIRYKMKNFGTALIGRFLNDVLFLAGILFFYKKPIDSSKIQFKKLM